MEEYQHALKEYGLSQNEIGVYIALLKLGESNVHHIAKNSGLPRTTTYHILESLNQKGLVSFVIKENKKHYAAVSPARLSEKLEEKKNIIDKVIPQLSAIAESINKKPEITVFEGINGIKNILQDVLDSKEEILHYGDIITLQSKLEFIFPQYIHERVKRKIPIKIIAKKEEIHEELIKNQKKEYRTFKFLPKNYKFKTSLFLYNEKVAILNLTSEPYYGVIMNNKDFYDTQKTIFELLWNVAKY